MGDHVTTTNSSMQLAPASFREREREGEGGELRSHIMQKRHGGIWIDRARDEKVRIYSGSTAVSLLSCDALIHK